MRAWPEACQYILFLLFCSFFPFCTVLYCTVVQCSAVFFVFCFLICFVWYVVAQRWCSQSRLCELGACRMVFEQLCLGRKHDDSNTMLLRTAISLLDGGNRLVQDEFQRLLRVRRYAFHMHIRIRARTPMCIPVWRSYACPNTPRAWR